MRTSLALLLLALCALPAAADEWADFQALIKDKDPDKRCQAIDKIKRFKNARMVQALLPVLGDSHPRVRYRAMRAVGAVNDPTVVDLLVKHGLKSGDKVVRQLTCEALAWIKDERTVDALVSALEDPDPAVRAQAADTLGWMRAKAKKAVDPLLGVFERDRAWEPRSWALDAVGRLEPARAGEAVEKALTDKVYAMRMTAAFVAPKVSKDLGTRAVRELIGDADWRVRVAAIEAAVETRTRECVGHLIGQWAKEKGRLRWDLFLAVTDLTEKDLGLDPKSWQAWWNANKDTFEPVPKSGGRDGQAPTAGGGTRAEFFKIPIFSNRLSFVLDLSGSMRDETPGVGSKATKLDVAKKGMVQTISKFEHDVWFNIINLGCDQNGVYRKDQKIWKKKLTDASDPAKADATKFVNRQEARGWTNIWDGIEYAFEDPEVDTIFLYSDGGASRGVWTSTWEILTALEKMNRFRKIMIFTVETPAKTANTEDNIKLMKDLATSTKGSYRLAEEK